MDRNEESVNCPQGSSGWQLQGPATIRSLRAGLYLVATPIGNLRDITLRALDTIAACDMLVCEDTRVSGKLLQAYGIKKPLRLYNDHSDEGRRDELLAAIREGRSVALISDAGTPLVSDPGYKLVRAALAQDLYVTALPGANAPLTALQLSGLPSDAFTFAGFLPPKDEARRDRLRQWRQTPGTLVFFETAPRLLKTLAAMRAEFGDRDAAVLRELTKLYEEGRRGSLSDLLAHYDERGAPKGEIVIVVGAAAADAAGDATALLEDALAAMSLRDAVLHVAELTGQPKKSIYALALSLAGAGGGG